MAERRRHSGLELHAAVTSAQSGVGHSKEQVFTWLDSLAEGKKLPIPAPDVFPEQRSSKQVKLP